MLDIRCYLGEGPLYEPARALLHFLDIARGEVHHYSLETKEHTIDYYEGHPSCIRLRDGSKEPGFIAAVDRGFAFLPPRCPSSSSSSPSSLTYHTLLPESEHPLTKMHNEGETDPQGRFLAGTKPARGEPMEGKEEEVLWRIEGGKEGEKVERLIEGMGLPNGMGWSRDGKTLFVTDSAKCEITQSDYDPSSGKLSNHRVFASSPRSSPTGLSPSFPDGLCVDLYDNVYSAHFGGSKIVRYLPSGEPDLEIHFEGVLHITACELGGKEGKTLFVTTASLDESGDGDKEDLKRRFPKSGAVWAVDLSGEETMAKERYKFKG
ncbi:SMP-30/gluconolactonase/LRE family protein [Sporobolomyces salmoneus]|uniref:SMP-30/gluconolactonase/LRE family protein n=1 Tax=Sporobolomyces salmoneus TaxID=183962 RepID=UPI0031749C13